MTATDYDSGATTAGGLRSSYTTPACPSSADADLDKGKQPFSFVYASATPASSSALSTVKFVSPRQQKRNYEALCTFINSPGIRDLPLRDSEDDMDPAFQVRFEGPNDPEDPHNLPSLTKAIFTLILGLLAFTGSLGSSIVTPAEQLIAKDLGMSYEETVLLLALFVLGFALGPLLWAPISEAYGRRWSMLPAVFILGVFSIGSATSKTPAALLATRFLGGVFGSAPISNVSAALGDIYPPIKRGVAMAFYSICVVGGPCLAPVVGAAIAYNPHMGWRWILYLEALIAFFSCGVALLFLPETYGPVLLERKAARLRKQTEGGDPRYWHPHEFERVTLDTIVTKHLSRPLRMFFTEPIVTCIALYASFVYGVLFMALEVFPIVFRDNRGYGPVVANLPFLALFVGAFVAMGINIANQPLYAKAVARQGNGKAVPEARLPPIFLGGILFSVGFFWFGWTAAPRFHWAIPTVAGGFIGCGFNIVFQQCLNYLVDSYGQYAASATSANTVLRSLLACALPLAAKPMFTNLGVGPASSVLGGISCLALPAPILFKIYGPRLRAMSKFAN
ncbi:hypothetical protein SEUCBS140593_009930 [Sporothrix eucalyptigena]|uniref:Major facilitator superfamily (MFS) profile domain-containing protein n=1 Tax=Sporothrix eucalyptigena TaxID=1812306 RepID=A0ABP0D2L2_9PEZI